jgi:hypothetical protein
MANTIAPSCWSRCSLNCSGAHDAGSEGGGRRRLCVAGPLQHGDAYHTFIQAGVVAQGLLQYLAVAAPKLVWDTFGSWLRTIRPGIPPSEIPSSSRIPI